MPNVYYTGGGDKGETSLAKSRVKKDDTIIQAIGAVDELNSYLGVTLFYLREDLVRDVLRAMQNELFTIGANLSGAKPVDNEFYAKATKRLENEIDDMSKRIPEQRKFVLPGGVEGAAHLHYARTLSRRAERKLVAAGCEQALTSYLNRVSSYLFVAALYVNFTNGVEETNPKY